MFQIPSIHLQTAFPSWGAERGGRGSGLILTDGGQRVAAVSVCTLFCFVLLTLKLETTAGGFNHSRTGIYLPVVPLLIGTFYSDLPPDTVEHSDK